MSIKKRKCIIHIRRDTHTRCNKVLRTNPKTGFRIEIQPNRCAAVVTYNDIIIIVQY